MALSALKSAGLSDTVQNQNQNKAISLSDGETHPWGWSSGSDLLDERLPDMLRRRDRVQDIAAHQAADRGAALALGCNLMRRIMLAAETAHHPILYLSGGRTEHDLGRLHGWGLRCTGISARQIIHVQCHNLRDIWFTLEEALDSGAVGGLIADLDDRAVAGLDITVGRRLNLATERNRLPLLLLRDQGAGSIPTAWNSWSVAARPSAANQYDAKAPGMARCGLNLIRSKTGIPPLAMEVAWDDQADRLHLVAELADHGTPATVAARHKPGSGQLFTLPFGKGQRRRHVA
ncbi:MAG: hypothetical protein KI792_08565 [Alphaproteobacteria bacterium]|nr:hypothetical protein [Alphaproteobacteria bacterium SS10]